MKNLSEKIRIIEDEKLNLKNTNLSLTFFGTTFLSDCEGPLFSSKSFSLEPEIIESISGIWKENKEKIKELTLKSAYMQFFEDLEKANISEKEEIGNMSQSLSEPVYIMRGLLSVLCEKNKVEKVSEIPEKLEQIKSEEENFINFFYAMVSPEMKSQFFSHLKCLLVEGGSKSWY